MVGDKGSDLLIVGETAHDDDTVALRQVLTEWSSGKAYTTRVNNLLNGIGVPLLDANNTVVGDNNAENIAIGGRETDLFFTDLVKTKLLDVDFGSGIEQVVETL